MNRFLRPALAFAIVCALVQPGYARRVSVDFDGTSFDTTGQSFAFADTTFGVGSGSISFALNFGAGAKNYDYCMNSNGFVAFVLSGTSCSSSATPTGDYVAPFSTALTLGTNTLRSSGSVDSVHSGSASDPFNLADATAAYRFIWDATDAANNPVLAELLLLDKGSGNFDLQFAYGSDLFGIDGAPATGQQIVNLGSNVAGPVSGPFSTTTDYGFSVVDGKCAGCTGGGGDGGGTVTVPEPSVLSLFAVGLLMLPFVRRFRANA